MVSNYNNFNQLLNGRESDQEIRCSIGLAYLFFYNLLQFCGHTWIFSNMTARFLSFGLDALAGTFYFVGVMMSVCQLLSILELFHIADEIEENRLLPRFVQVVERNFLLFLLISQSEIQSKPIVCVLFYLWNTLGLLRYPYQLLCLISTPSFNMLWVRHTIYIPVYILSVITEDIGNINYINYYMEDTRRELANRQLVLDIKESVFYRHCHTVKPRRLSSKQHQFLPMHFFHMCS
ncbi:very-long-chain (3R)-3-hydroxyacyl-CoA dehydratase 4 isoform X2 [Trichomycterus rosablanca]|uniref:very-long-chain (3R)-3-hydroxyacyl-CoA dehydratase 4 isoform X2 n=1 Tax=Trichomycterus rosablanca TaxID=2290929 RepID=UPI002F3601C1